MGHAGWLRPRGGESSPRATGATRGPTITVPVVRIATWNVNSVKQRVPRLLPWLDERSPDVVCLQETKLGDAAFEQLLGSELASRGYAFALHGEVQSNGVAILSASASTTSSRGSPTPRASRPGGARRRRHVRRRARPFGLRAQRPRARLRALPLQARVAGGPRGDRRRGPDAVVVCGDMNIAPADADVFDPDAYIGQTHVTPPEREALARLLATGLHDVVRDRWATDRVFTYWDYRAGMFHQDLGMRIDLVLASRPVAARVRAAWVDRQARKGSGPSDHAP